MNLYLIKLTRRPIMPGFPSAMKVRSAKRSKETVRNEEEGWCLTTSEAREDDEETRNKDQKGTERKETIEPSLLDPVDRGPVCGARGGVNTNERSGESCGQVRVDELEAKVDKGVFTEKVSDSKELRRFVLTVPQRVRSSGVTDVDLVG